MKLYGTRGRYPRCDPFLLHGVQNYDISFSLVAALDQIHTARLTATEVYADPRPGDTVLVHMVSVLNLPTRIEKKA